MPLTGTTRWALVVLTACFLGAAALKILHLLVLRDWVLLIPLMRAPWLLWSSIGLDVVIAIGLWSRWRDGAAWLAIALAITGNMALAYARFVYGAGVTCGCLGRLPLSYWEHAIMSGCVFVLAAMVLTLGHATPSPDYP